MTEAALIRHQEKEARMRAAIAHREGDRVPINVGGGTFAVTDAGYTMAEINYDESLLKMKDAIIRFLNTYDPDTAMGPSDFAGECRGYDMLGLTYMEWPGKPGTAVDDNSIQQFLEFPILLDDEFEKFYTDRTGWKLNNSMPKISSLCAPLADLQIPLSHHGSLKDLAAAFSTPDMRNMLQKLWEANDFFTEMGKRRMALMSEIAQLGYPSYFGGKVCVPFDEYSDTLRGTILSLTDLYEYPEEMERFIAEYYPTVLDSIKTMNKDGSRDGKFVLMTLHKGVDGFMSDEYYVKYYWRYLQEIIQTIVDNGMIPFVFAEGKYQTRLSHLADIPKGKVIYKFENTPIELAKKAVGDVACIETGISNVVLDFGSRQKVIDECKRVLDIGAPGGGFIFGTATGLGSCKRENVDAMFETVREYGRF